VINAVILIIRCITSRSDWPFAMGDAEDELCLILSTEMLSTATLPSHFKSTATFTVCDKLQVISSEFF